MSWLSKILFPNSNRHERHVKLLNLLLAAGLVIIIALVAVLLYLSKWRWQ